VRGTIAAMSTLHTGGMTMKGKAALLGAFTAVAVAAPAEAGTYICVPTTAGAAIVSGGTSGTCAWGSTTVQMPSAAADQQTLISMLPYMSFTPTGIGSKPTITITGANLRMLHTTAAVNGKDGTGNIVLGGGSSNYQSASLTGSENLIVGWYHQWTNDNNIVGGIQNKAQGFGGLIGGALNTSGASANDVALFGYQNKANGNVSSAVGGSNNTTAGDYSTVSGGNGRTIAAKYGGDEDVGYISYDALGNVISKTIDDAVVYRGGTGFTWVYIPGRHLPKCAVSATPATENTSITARRMYASSYEDWLAIATTANGTYTDSPVNLMISCPTS
jgi:hypothetical protein